MNCLKMAKKIQPKCVVVKQWQQSNCCAKLRNCCDWNIVTAAEQDESITENKGDWYLK